MRMIVGAVVACAVGMSGVRVGADSASPCTFNLAADRPAPEIGGRGTLGSAEEVSVVAKVEWVTSAACKYMPSQAWPITQPSR